MAGGAAGASCSISTEGGASSSGKVILSALYHTIKSTKKAHSINAPVVPAKRTNGNKTGRNFQLNAHDKRTVKRDSKRFGIIEPASALFSARFFPDEASRVDHGAVNDGARNVGYESDFKMRYATKGS